MCQVLCVYRHTKCQVLYVYSIQYAKHCVYRHTICQALCLQAYSVPSTVCLQAYNMPSTVSTGIQCAKYCVSAGIQCAKYCVSTGLQCARYCVSTGMPAPSNVCLQTYRTASATIHVSQGQRMALFKCHKDSQCHSSRVTRTATPTLHVS
jgi:hypothetical protein